ncbi:hypothetical protein WG66_007850 [Moniliophthora roreri]|nr:hypothetical protein WG66_007850 [Moniliophthora roreri]
MVITPRVHLFNCPKHMFRLTFLSYCLPCQQRRPSFHSRHPIEPSPSISLTFLPSPVYSQCLMVLHVLCSVLSLFRALKWRV